MTSEPWRPLIPDTGPYLSLKVIAQLPRAISLPFAGRLANLLLEPHEIARGVAIIVSGFNLGFAMGYILPPVTVTNQLTSTNATAMTSNFTSAGYNESLEVDYDLMNEEMFSLHLSTAIFSLIILVGFLVLYTHDPEPVNRAEKQRVENLLLVTSKRDQFKAFLTTYKNLFKNLNFVTLLISSGFIHG